MGISSLRAASIILDKLSTTIAKIFSPNSAVALVVSLPTIPDFVYWSILYSKRNRVIRVRDWTYEKLREFGSSKNDFDDVIFTLTDFWEKHHRK